MMGDDSFYFVVEIVAVEHDDIPASEAADFYVRADPNNLKAFGPSFARVGLFHFDFVI